MITKDVEIKIDNNEDCQIQVILLGKCAIISLKALISLEALFFY